MARADTFARASAGAENTSSRRAFSHSRRALGSAGALGRSGEPAGRGAVPSSGCGPFLVGAGSPSPGGGEVGDAAGVGGCAPATGASSNAARTGHAKTGRKEI